jgi:hypothetical protein
VQVWRYEDAAQKIERLGVEGLNREFAAYWLSLWRGDAPPLLSVFDPLKVAKLLPSLVMVEVRPGASEHCRAAGSNVSLALGFELTGKDLIAMTPQVQRRERVRLVEDIVLGGLSTSYRTFLRSDGHKDIIQELAVPFADMTVDGSLRYLVHTNWRPTEQERFPGTARCDARVAKNIRVETLS